MAGKPQISSLDEAKAALDEEIAGLEALLESFRGRIATLKSDGARYEEAFWRLKSVRRRMDPPEVPEVAEPMAIEDDVAVAEAA